MNCLTFEIKLIGKEILQEFPDSFWNLPLICLNDKDAQHFPILFEKRIHRSKSS